VIATIGMVWVIVIYACATPESPTMDQCVREPAAMQLNVQFPTLPVCQAFVEALVEDAPDTRGFNCEPAQTL